MNERLKLAVEIEELLSGDGLIRALILQEEFEDRFDQTYGEFYDMHSQAIKQEIRSMHG